MTNPTCFKTINVEEEQSVNGGVAGFLLGVSSSIANEIISISRGNPSATWGQVAAAAGVAGLFGALGGAVVGATPLSVSLSNPNK